MKHLYDCTHCHSDTKRPLKRGHLSHLSPGQMTKWFRGIMGKLFSLTNPVNLSDKQWHLSLCKVRGLAPNMSLFKITIDISRFVDGGSFVSFFKDTCKVSSCTLKYVNKCVNTSTHARWENQAFNLRFKKRSFTASSSMMNVIADCFNLCDR